MSDIKNKVLSIDKKVAAIDDKMKQLMLQKKEILQQKKELEEQEILDVVRNNGASASSVNNALELVKLLKDNNLTKDDILELIYPQQPNSIASTFTNTNSGGIENEND